MRTVWLLRMAVPYITVIIVFNPAEKRDPPRPTAEDLNLNTGEMDHTQHCSRQFVLRLLLGSLGVPISRLETRSGSFSGLSRDRATAIDPPWAR